MPDPKKPDCMACQDCRELDTRSQVRSDIRHPSIHGTESMLRQARLGAFEVNVRTTPRFVNLRDRVGSGRREPTTIRLIRRAARDKLYIDVGGWFGATVMAGALVADQVIACEPDPVAFEELRANFRTNDFVNVRIREVAPFDRNGTVSFGPGAGDALGRSESGIVIGEATTSARSVDVLDEVGSDEEQPIPLAPGMAPAIGQSRKVGLCHDADGLLAVFASRAMRWRAGSARKRCRGGRDGIGQILASDFRSPERRACSARRTKGITSQDGCAAQ